MPFERIKEVLGIEKVLEWDHSRHPGLVWRVPDTKSSVEEEIEIQKAYAFRVKMGERAIALLENTFYDDCPPGYYRLADEEKRRRVEIIWIDQGEFKQDWGIFDVPTKDDILVGAHGLVYLRVAEPKNFITALVSTKREYTPEQVGDWIKDTMNNIVRQSVTSFTVKELIRSLTNLVLLARGRCAELFSRWGLEFVNLEIVYPLKLPEGYEKILAGQLIIREWELQKTLMDLDLQYKKAQIQNMTQEEIAKIVAKESIHRGLTEEETKTIIDKITADKTIVDKTMELYQKEAELDRMKKMHELDLGRIDWEEELRKREEESSSKARIIEVESKTGVTQAEAQAQMRISATKAREAEIKTGAQEIETVKAGEAKVKELDERAKVAGDIAKIDADTRQKEILLKAEVEKERVKAEILKSDREFELKGKEIDGKVKIEVERARQDSNREERKSEIEKEKVIWSGKADVAEAVAKGGIEGVEAKRAAEVEYFKEASPHVDVVEVERVRALKEAPPKEMIIIETKETKPFAEPASSEEKRILELKKERYNTLVRMLSEKGISEEFANATEKEIERLKQEIERLEQLRK